MTHHPDDAPHHPSREALYLFGYLQRRGGSQRMAPLLRDLAIDPRVFTDAVNDLEERYWIVVVWSQAPPGTPDDQPRPLAEVYRLCTTRFGRQKYRTAWPQE